MCVPKMKLGICWLIVWSLYVSASGREDKRDVNPSPYITLGYGLELLLTKFDIISSKLQKVEDKLQRMEEKQQSNERQVNDNLKSVESKLLTIENSIQKQGSIQGKVVTALEDHRSSQDQSLKEIFNAIQKLEHQVALNLSKVNDNIQKHASVQGEIVDSLKNRRSSQEQNQKEVFAVLHKLENQVAFNLREVHNRDHEEMYIKLNQLETGLSGVLQFQKRSIPSSCKNVPSKLSGTYLIRVKRDSEPFEVYCEEESYGGGWIVFQYRYDGSLDFDRLWNEFRDGFGDLNKEFWLGLEKVHQITSGRKHELVVELKDFNGIYTYARYDAFEIGSERDKYDVKDIGEYSGTAGDDISYLKGTKFTTKDQDNDEYWGHCAQNYEGAWWHWGCTGANLNGRYINAVDDKSMHWSYLNNNRQGLSYSRMMIRELK